MLSLRGHFLFTTSLGLGRLSELHQQKREQSVHDRVDQRANLSGASTLTDGDHAAQHTLDQGLATTKYRPAAHREYLISGFMINTKGFTLISGQDLFSLFQRGCPTHHW